MTDTRPDCPSELYNPEIAPFRAEYDWGETPPSVAVLRTVAVATNRDPTALPSLYRCVDPDRLDKLVGQALGSPDVAPLQISFSYAGHQVIIEGGGTVSVMPQSRGE